MKLVTGASGQIGSDLVLTLAQQLGNDQVLASGRRPMDAAFKCPYTQLDVTDKQQLIAAVKTYPIDTIYHLAGILSARGEQTPDSCWKTNIEGLRNVLDVAACYHLKVFWPSSIAAFGPHTPKLLTPQITIADPVTMYGITKATGELLCQYFAQRYELDVRSLRFPGIISHRTLPGGGTTDFAVEVFLAALKYGHYTSFVRPDTRLPMIYMPDAIRAVLFLMAAPAKHITVRTSYNLGAVSFSMAELVSEIQHHLPAFTCDYAPDYRQAIADSWPAIIDDTQARQDWGWSHQYDLSAIVKDMLVQLSRLPSLSPSPSPNPSPSEVSPCSRTLPTRPILTSSKALASTKQSVSSPHPRELPSPYSKKPRAPSKSSTSAPTTT